MALFKRKTYTDMADEVLMDEISLGKRQAFEVIYHRYFNRLCRFSADIVGNASDAEDVVQEVFMMIIHNKHGYDTTRTFSTWIYTATANRSRNHLRNIQNRQRILQEKSFLSNDHLDEESLIRSADRELLSKLVSSILTNKSSKEKKLYSLRFEQDLSISEIAEILDIPEGSVKSGLYYLLKKIAREWKQNNYEHR